MTNRPTKGRRPTGADVTEGSCGGASTRNGRTPCEGAFGPSMLMVTALAVALLLAAAPAWAQEAEVPGSEETPEATAMEAGDGPPRSTAGAWGRPAGTGPLKSAEAAG